MVICFFLSTNEIITDGTGMISNPPMLILGDGKLPLDVTGDLSSPQGPLCRKFDFSFVYCDIPCAAVLREEGGEAELTVTARLGPLPFSAESARARGSLQAIIDAANQSLGGVFTVTDGQIRLTLTAHAPGPVGAVTVVTAVTRLLVPVKPYLACLALFLTPPWANGVAVDPRLRPEFSRSAARLAKARQIAAVHAPTATRPRLSGRPAR
jgi:hypothetical protein